MAGNASHALLAQLCGDGTAAVARDAYYALAQQKCVARSAAPHSGARHALLRQQQSLGRTARARPQELRCVLGTPISVSQIQWDLHLKRRGAAAALAGRARRPTRVVRLCDS